MKKKKTIFFPFFCRDTHRVTVVHTCWAYRPAVDFWRFWCSTEREKLGHWTHTDNYFFLCSKQDERRKPSSSSSSSFFFISSSFVFSPVCQSRRYAWWSLGKCARRYLGKGPSIESEREEEEPEEKKLAVRRLIEANWIATPAASGSRSFRRRDPRDLGKDQQGNFDDDNQDLLICLSSTVLLFSTINLRCGTKVPSAERKKKHSKATKTPSSWYFFTSLNRQQKMYGRIIDIPRCLSETLSLSPK